ncbi:MAG: methyltransferase [Gammaproteobacteria bacterium]|nr:methyltransferase [Gammaproteobacteria bacterium]
MSESQRSNKLYELSVMFIIAKAVHIASDLALYELINEQSQLVNDLAEKLNFSPIGLHKLLTLLDAYDLVKYKHGLVCSTPDTPLLQYVNSPHLYLNYKNVENLENSLRNNTGVFDITYDNSFYGYLKDHHLVTPFEHWCTESAKQWLPIITDMYDFSPYTTIIDIGGGQGYLLSMILDKNKHITGTLLDQNEVIKNIAAEFAQHVDSNRASVMAGDFFDASTLPTGKDLYITCRTLLNWSDDDSCKMLNNIYEVMPQKSKLLLIDFYIPEKSHPHYKRALLSDMALHTLMSGSNRNLQEWQNLILGTKFKLNKVYTSEGNVKYEPFMPLFIFELSK